MSDRSAERMFGSMLTWVGILGLPLVLGVMLGYYLGDRGVLWLPTMLHVILLISVVSLVAIATGKALEGSATKATPEGVKLRRRVVSCLVLAMALILGRLFVYWMEEPSALTQLSAAEFNEAFAIDAERYQEFDAGLHRQLEAFAAQGDLFEEDSERILTADEEDTLRALWTATYDYAFALDQIRLFYEDWFRFDPSRAQRSYHLRSYLLTFAAELTLYETSSRLVELITKNPNAVKFLDSPHEEAGIGPNSFSQYREQLQGARDQARYLAGQQYLLWLEAAMRGREESQELGCSWLWDKIEEEVALVNEFSPVGLTAQTLSSDFEVFRRAVDRVWYPAQKGVAEWMGDTRLRRIGVYLITEDQQDTIAETLEPGDIILSRKNWHLSNVGLPGFWPHAVLYIGGPADFDAFFDDPDVQAYINEVADKPGRSLGDYLAEKYPTRWLRYRAGHDDETYRVIEGIAEGVVLNTLSHACGDYLAAIRPRLDKRAKAQAIVEAFSHLDKPYDYNFDFATDHALVCTELVWRSYRPADGKKGLNFQPVEIAGRWALPANEIAKQFAEEYGTPGAQFDFVYFIDALEEQGRTFEADLDTFLDTHFRTKWDLALE